MGCGGASWSVWSSSRRSMATRASVPCPVLNVFCSECLGRGWLSSPGRHDAEPVGTPLSAACTSASCTGISSSARWSGQGRLAVTVDISMSHDSARWAPCRAEAPWTSDSPTQAPASLTPTWPEPRPPTPDQAPLSAPVTAVTESTCIPSSSSGGPNAPTPTPPPGAGSPCAEDKLGTSPSSIVWMAESYGLCDRVVDSPRTTISSLASSPALYPGASNDRLRARRQPRTQSSLNKFAIYVNIPSIYVDIP